MKLWISKTTLTGKKTIKTPGFYFTPYFSLLFKKQMTFIKLNFKLTIWIYFSFCILLWVSYTCNRLWMEYKPQGSDVRALNSRVLVGQVLLLSCVYFCGWRNLSSCRGKILSWPLTSLFTAPFFMILMVPFFFYDFCLLFLILWKILNKCIILSTAGPFIICMIIASIL